jgi:hypothetical protein
MEHTRRSKWLLSLFTTIVCVGGLELYCRCFPSWQDAFVVDVEFNQLPADIYQSQELPPGVAPSKMRFRHRPNSRGVFVGAEYNTLVEINALGMRGNMPTTNKELLLLGDSFVFAGQVDWQESVAGIVSRNEEWSVLNAGVDGYGTLDALALYTSLRQQNKIHPKRLWLFFFWGNDISDNYASSAEDTMVTMAPMEPMENASRILPIAPTQWSALYRRIYGSMAARSDQRFVDKQREMDVLYHLQPDSVELQPTKRAIQVLSTHCQNIECTVIWVPPVEAMEDASLHATVVPILQKLVPENMAQIDLYPILQKQGGRSLYFQYDPHWNKVGNRVVGNYLESILQ